MKTVAVSDLKKHGKIHEDSEGEGREGEEEGAGVRGKAILFFISPSVHFGSFLLSASGRQLLYIAEREKPKAASFFKKSPGE